MAPTPITKQKGVTEAEKYLSKLCAKSFLSLWSYPGVYRDQQKLGTGDGKEICDLLVLFENDLVIFSDKDCRFTSGKSLDVEWSRWYRRAIKESAEQLWGAERWLRQHPNRVFVDRRCSQALPVPMPKPEQLRLHRIVVAHNAASRCRELLGGSGSLVILPALAGAAHTDGPSQQAWIEAWRQALSARAPYDSKVLPFAIGDIDPSQGFIHVFDDIGLDIVLSELDTISDFTSYLRSREDYIRSGRLLMAAGEDDLLAHYLQGSDEKRARTFFTPNDATTQILIPEGEWEKLQKDPSWIARKKADRDSYLWDELIERFNEFILDGTSAAYPKADFKMQELAVRVLARESRFHRRILTGALIDFVSTMPKAFVATRVVKPLEPLGPYYVFVAVEPQPGEDYDKYRLKRRGVAEGYLIAAKQKYDDAKEVIAIATESRTGTPWTTADILFHGNAELSEDEIEYGRKIGEHLNLLGNLGEPVHTTVSEYPNPNSSARMTKSRNPTSIRNSPCPCGSGQKYKKCCLRDG